MIVEVGNPSGAKVFSYQFAIFLFWRGFKYFRSCIMECQRARVNIFWASNEVLHASLDNSYKSVPIVLAVRMLHNSSCYDWFSLYP
jgi:hypothetical protein